MPRAVTPWLTALRAYSGGFGQLQVIDIAAKTKSALKMPFVILELCCGRLTDLNQLSAAEECLLAMAKAPNSTSSYHDDFGPTWARKSSARMSICRP